MMNSRTIIESLSSEDLRSATRELVRRSHVLDANLLVHLGDRRRDIVHWWNESTSTSFRFFQSARMSPGLKRKRSYPLAAFLDEGPPGLQIGPTNGSGYAFGANSRWRARL